MKILSVEQVREWDQYTIQHEPVSSLDLMERAAAAATAWIIEHSVVGTSYHIFCGKGNNGGDGLAIARQLCEHGYSVNVDILEFGHKGTEDFQANLARLHQYPSVNIRFIQAEESIHVPAGDEVVIDALFGSGLNRALEGVSAVVVENINRSGRPVISIDLPSGLFGDRSSVGNPIVKASHTLTFQCMKLALLVAENADFTGEVHVLDIGLDPSYLQNIETRYNLIDREMIAAIYKPRGRFGHKGTYGHALVIAGSYGKIGAAVLAAGACLRSGAGLVSCHIPKCGYEIMQSAVPEAMVMTDFNSSFVTKIEADLTSYKSVGIGPGIGRASETVTFLQELLKSYNRPMVLDADALNITGSNRHLLKAFPKGSILTPHPKEFTRLFDESKDEFDRIGVAMRKAKELGVVIVLKGHHTTIATPDGNIFFNSTGNAGMATGGSGDVLTGILTGLLAQGYESVEAAVLGVYLHGLAGDIAAAELSKEAMIAGDIVKALGLAYQQSGSY